MLVVVLVITGVLAALSQSVFSRNETRLLKLRVRDAGSVLGAVLPSIQTTLASASELADATDGSITKFKAFMAPYVGSGSQSLLVSASMWRLAAENRGPVTTLGIAPKLAPDAAGKLFARAGRGPTLSVVGLLSPPSRRLGYAFVTPGAGGRFAVYGERTIPTSQRSKISRNSAFTGLNYALYLGSRPAPQNLLLTSTGHTPLGGRTASVTVPFGDKALTLVMSPVGSLSGSLPERLSWIIAVVGVLLAVASAVVAQRLIERRRSAESLAATLETTASENRRLYAEQRGIAKTLQHALLPEKLPQIGGIETGAVYTAGEPGMEIGGDWYDLIVLADRRLLMVVGDVAGRGLRAATTMAALRYAIHAYAAQGDAPEQILTKLSKLLDVGESGQIATVLCLLVSVDRRDVTICSAGHLPPLLITNGHGEYLRSAIGLPIGVESDVTYTATSFSVPPAAKLLAFTDGLVERRGEHLDQGLERLRSAALSRNGSLPGFLTDLAADLHDEHSEDDSALVGVRWTS